MRPRLLVVLVLAGCTPAPTIRPAWDPAPREPAAPPPEPDAVPPPRTAQAEAMHAWMLQLADVRDAAVAGDLDAVHAGARSWLAAVEDDVADDWRTQVQDVRREATALSEAKALPEASDRIARLAGSCGRCHEAQGVVDRVGKHLTPDTDPPKGDSSEAVMLQHRWASTRMWEGLVGPSESRWARGTTMFLVLPRCPDDDAAADHDRCRRARALARRAHLADAAEGRISLYGRLLTTCADCHTAGGTP